MHNSHGPAQEEAHCLICGVKLSRRSSRAVEMICLICRAAILDRIFHTRRQRVIL